MAASIVRALEYSRMIHPCTLGIHNVYMSSCLAVDANNRPIITARNAEQVLEVKINLKQLQLFLSLEPDRSVHNRNGILQ